MAMKGWLLDDGYIIWMIIPYLGRSMVLEFKYKQIKCKNNIRLFKFIDWLTIKIVHEIPERLEDQI